MDFLFRGNSFKPPFFNLHTCANAAPWGSRKPTCCLKLTHAGPRNWRQARARSAGWNNSGARDSATAAPSTALISPSPSPTNSRRGRQTLSAILFCHAAGPMESRRRVVSLTSPRSCQPPLERLLCPRLATRPPRAETRLQRNSGLLRTRRRRRRLRLSMKLAAALDSRDSGATPPASAPPPCVSTKRRQVDCGKPLLVDRCSRARTALLQDVGS